MAAIVSGTGLGLFSSNFASANGDPHVGRSGQSDAVYVNSANGNLVVQAQDEFLASVGLDTALIRTYNSRGQSTDDNGDNWQLNVASLINRPATPNASGSTVTKRFGDGAEVIYTYDAARALYISSEGDGAADTLSYNASTSQWTWTDGDTRSTETYNSAGQMVSARDADGNAKTYTYTGALLTQIRDTSGQDTFLDYTGNNLSKVRVVSQGVTQTLTRYGYDTSNRLTSVTVDLTPQDNAVTDGKTYVTTYTYDGTSKRIASITHADGTKITFTYDSSGRVKTYTDGAGKITTLDYTTGAGTPTVATANFSALTNPTWSVESLRESTDVAVVGHIETAFDQNGNGMAVWGQAGNIYSSTYVKSNNTWSAATTLSSDGSSYSPYLSMSANGTALVVWVSGTGGFVARRFMSGSWNTATQVIAEFTAWETVPVCSINDAGQAVVAVRQHPSSTASNLWVARLNGSTWSAPLALDDIGGATNQPVAFGVLTPVNAAIDASGNVTIVWLQNRPGETVNSIFVSRYILSTNTWSTPSSTSIENAAVAIDDLAFATNQSGDGMVVWAQGGSIMARSYIGSSNTWGGVVTLAASAGQVSFSAPNLAISGNGNVLASWSRYDAPSNTRAQMANRYVGGSWGTSTLISRGTTSTDAVWKTDGSINNNGEAAVIFTEINNADPTPVYNVFVSRFAQGVWQTQTRVDANPNSALSNFVPPTVAIDAQGNINALWVKPRVGAPAGDNTLYNSRLASFVPYYTVVTGDTWAGIATKVYGDPEAANALQAAMSNPALTTGLKLTVPGTITFTKASSILNQTDVKDPLNQVTSYLTDGSGKLRQILSPAVNGVRLSASYVYDSRGNVTQIVDENGNATVLSYDANDNLISRRDALGNTCTYTYSAANQLLTETHYLAADPDGAGPALPTQPLTTRYVYDAENHLRYVVSAAGRVTESRYDASGNRIATVRYVVGVYNLSALAPADSLTEAQLANTANWSQIPDLSKIERTDYAYDFRGQVSATTVWASVNASGAGVADGNQSVTQFVYDQRGRLLQTLDARATGAPNAAAANTAYATTYTYDGLGRVLTASQWVSGTEVRTTVTSVYDDVNNKVVTTLANGLAATRVYDKRGLLLSVAQSNGSTALGTTSYQYDDDGRLRIVTDALGNKTHMLYDEAGRMVASIDTTGALVENVYDAAGNVIKQISYAARPNATQLASLINAGNPANVTLSSVRPAIDNSNDRVVRSVYDTAGRLVMTITPHDTDATKGYVEQNFYDGDGRLTDNVAYATAINLATLPAVPTPAQVTALVSTSAGDRLNRIFYDAEGLQVGALDAEGYLVENQYNAAGELTHTVGYALPTTANLRSAGTFAQLKASVTTTPENANNQHDYFFYNNKGELAASLDAEGYLTEFSYDKAGNRTQQTRYYNKAAAYTGTQTVAQLRPAAHANDAVTVSTYNGANELFTVTDNPAGTVTRYTYNNVGDVVKAERAWNTAEVRTDQVRYDAKGRVLQQLTANGSVALAALGATPTQAQIDGVWNQHSVTYAYDLADRTISVVDQNGNKTLFYYDEENRLRYAVNAMGEVTETRYNAFGETIDTFAYTGRIATAGLTGGSIPGSLVSAVAAIATPATDLHTSALYTLRGAVKAALEALNATTNYTRNYTYNAFGELDSELNPVVNVAGSSNTSTQTLTKYTYDRRGLLTQVVNDDNNGSYVGIKRKIGTVYDAFGRVIQTTDGNGNIATVAYDRLGRTVAITDPSGTETTTYDAFDRVLTRKDRLLNTVATYVYNDAARSFTVTTAEGVVVTTSVNRHGETVSVVDGRGTATLYAYDANGNWTGTVEASGSLNLATTQTYDRANRVIRTTDARNVVTRIDYDAANRVLTRIVDPKTIVNANDNPNGLDLKTTYSYDGQGRTLTVTDQRNVVMQMAYDAKGQVTLQTTDPTGLNLQTSFVYDADSNALTVVNGVGSSNPITTRYVYDNLGRRIETHVDPSGLNITTKYTFDLNDNVSTSTDANGNVTRYYYDGNDRLIYALDALNGLAQTVYDADGQVIKRVVYANALTGGTFPANPSKTDIANRIPAIADAARDEVMQYVYDKDGRRTYSMNGLGEVSLNTYDANGNIVKTIEYGVRIAPTTAANASTIGVALSAAITAAGTNALPDLTTYAVYDAADRQIYSINGLGEATQFIYDANGNVIKSIDYANRIVIPATVNPTTVAAAITVNAATDLASYAVYDTANRAIYRFNALGEITQNTYDAAGNVVKTQSYANRIAPSYYLIPANPNGGALSWANIAVELYGNAAAASALQALPGLPALAAGNKIGFSTVLPATLTVSGVTYSLNTARLTDYKTVAEVAALTVADAARDLATYAVYDNAGRTVYRFNALGETTQFTYDANGNVVKTQAYANRITIPASITLASVASAVGAGSSADLLDYAVYDAAGRAAYTFNALGEVALNTYDGNGNIVKRVQYGVRIAPASLMTPITPTVVANAVSAAITAAGANALPNVTTYAVYNAANRLTYRFNGLGEVSEIVYDSIGWIAKTIRHVNRIVIPATLNVSTVASAVTTAGANADVDESITSVYDAAGQVIYTVNGQGEVARSFYDTHGNVVKTIEYSQRIPVTTAANESAVSGALGTAGAAAATTSYAVYDAGNRLVYSISATRAVTQFTYDAHGNVVKSLQYANSIVLPSALNAAAMTAAVRPSVADIARYAVYDAAGRAAFGVTALGEVTRNTYDAFGALIKTTRFAKVISTATTMTAAGVSAAIAIDAARDQTLQYAYDRAGRRVGAAQLDGAGVSLGTTSYFYDGLGRLAMTQDPLGLRAWILYDQANRKIADIDANGSLVEYSYDPNGQLTRQYAYATTLSSVALASLVNGSGQPTSPALSSVRPAAVAAGDRPTWFIYDAASRLIKTVNAEGDVTETVYDGESRIVKVIRYAKPLSTTPGTPPWNSTVTAPTSAMATPAANADDRTEYRYYDNEGRLVATVDGERYLSEFIYDAVGRLTLTKRYAAQLATNWQSAIPANPSGAIVLTKIRPAGTADDITTITLYDTNSRAVGVIDGNNYLTETMYDNFGNVYCVKRYATAVSATFTLGVSNIFTMRPLDDPLDRATTFYFDLGNRLIQETNAEGAITLYSYDSLGRLIRTDRAFGSDDLRTTATRYDIKGRVIAALTGEGSAALAALVSPTQAQIDAIWTQYGVSYAYDADDRRVSATDQYGNKTVFYYDEDSRLRFSINALGEVSETRYNALGDATTTVQYGTRLSAANIGNGGAVSTALTNAVNAIANSTIDSKQSLAYNITGTLATTTDALGAVATHAYNAFGERLSTSTFDSAEGRTFVQKSTYDRRGLVTREIVGEGTSTVEVAVSVNKAYDAFGRLTGVTDMGGHVSTQVYDRAGRVIQTRDALGNSQSTSYDPFDRVIMRTDALNRTTSYTYNTAERSMLVTTPENVTVKTFYNAYGQEQRVIDGNGRETRYSYDRDGRLIFTLDPMWNATSTTFDRAGRISVTTDPNGMGVVLSYDAANRVLTRTVDPTSVFAPNDNPNGLSLVTSYTYDAKGNRLTVTDPNLTVTRFEYDLKGQLRKQILDPAGLNIETSYAYDGRGNMFTVTDPNGTVAQYHFDAAGRRRSEAVNGVILRSYQYADGHLVYVLDANLNATRYVYNGNDQLVYAIDATGAVTKTDYDANGRVAKTTVYAQRLINFDTLPAAASVGDIMSRLPLDAARDQVVHRVYDKDGRLAATVNGLGEVVKFTYDGNGNVKERYAYALRLNMAAWTVGTIPFPPTDVVRDQRTRTIYDGANRAIYTIVDTSGGLAVTEQQYDRVGHVLERISYSRTIPAYTVITETDVRVAVAAVLDAARDMHTRMVYDRAGRLTHTARQLSATTMSVAQNFYDKVGNITKTIEYATAISATADPKTVANDTVRDRVTVFAYDRANRQVFSLDATGALMQQFFDKNGNVVETVAYATPVTAPVNTTVHTLASLSALVTSTVANNPDNRVSFALYDAQNRKTVSVDSVGGVVQTDYDAMGNAVQVTAHARRVEVSDLAPDNLRVFLTDRVALNTDPMHDRVTKLQYDGVGRLVGKMDALGYVTEVVYTATGNVARTVSYISPVPTAIEPSTILAVAHATQAPLQYQRTTDFDYDAAGRLLNSTDALGKKESYTYDGLGQKRSYTNKKSSVWTYDYDSAGRLVQENSPQVLVTGLSQTAPTDPLTANGGQTTSIITKMSYDALGNLTVKYEAFGLPDQRATQYQYDALGRQIKVIYQSLMIQNPNDTQFNSLARNEVSATLSTETRYDTLGNAYVGFNTDGGHASKVYDKLGRVRYEIDELGGITGYKRNTFGEATQVTRYDELSGFDSVVSQISVSDVDTRLASLNHAKDRTIYNQYDRLGRIVAVGEPTSYTYDSTFNYFGLAGKATYTSYNAFGEIFQISRNAAPFTGPEYVSTRYYDLVGNMIAEVDAEGYLTRDRFDSVGNLIEHVEYNESLVDWNGWDPANAPDDAPDMTGGESAPQARVTRYGYDLLNRKIFETKVGVEFSDDSTINNPLTRYEIFTRTADVTTTFGYDALGNQTRVTDSFGYSTYTYYDVLGRVRAVVSPARLGQANAEDSSVVFTRPLTEFLYDARGNVVAKFDYVLGASDIASEAGYSYYSPAQPASFQTVRGTFNKYDALDHLILTTDANGVNHYSSYNAQGKLARSWQKVTDDRLIASVAFQAYRYDATGRMIEQIDPAPVSAITPGMNSVQPTFTNPPIKMDASGRDYLPWSPYAPSLSGTLLNLPAQTEGSGQYQYVRYRPYGSSGAWTNVDWSHTQVVLPLPTSGTYAMEIDIGWGNASNNISKRYTGSIIKATSTGSPVLAKTTLTSNTYSIAWSGLINLNAGAVRVTFQCGGITRTQDYPNPTEVAGGVSFKWEDFNINGVSTPTGLVISQQINGVWTTVYPTSPNTLPGPVSTLVTYNNFGEVTSKNITGAGSGIVGGGEYYDYDSAGRLWRTNSGDGVDKIFLYDVQGNITAKIVSGGNGGNNVNLKSVADTAAAYGLTNVQRTDLYYDALGRVVKEVQPQRATQAYSVQARSLTVSAGGMTSASFQLNSHPQPTNPSYFSWVGTNKVTVTATGELASLGNGDVQVVVNYMTKAYTIGGVSHPSVLKTQTKIFTIDQQRGAVQNYLVDWADAPDTDGGIDSIAGVSILKQDIYGAWIPLGNTSFDRSKSIPWLTVPTPVDGSYLDVSLTLNGSPIPIPPTAFAPLSTNPAKFGSMTLYDMRKLEAGTYGYTVRVVGQDGVSRTVSTGSFAIVKPELVAGAGTRSIDAATGRVTFQIPQGDYPTFRYRNTAGGAWQTLFSTKGANSGANTIWTAEASALGGNGTYEFEILVSRGTSNYPYARGTGRITVASTTPKYTMVATGSSARNEAASLSAEAAGATLALTPALQDAGASARPVINRTFDRWGNVLSISDPRNAAWVTEFRYNAYNKMMDAIRPGEYVDGLSYLVNPVSHVLYDKLGQEIAIVESSNYHYGGGIYEFDHNINIKDYDGGGNVVRERHADGGIINYTYNNLGERVSMRDAMGNLTTFSYDNLGHLTKIARPGVKTGVLSNTGAATSTTYSTELATYDEMGRRITQTNGEGQMTRLRYDLRGNLIETVRPLGDSVMAAYDALGHKIMERDGNGIAQLWQYDYFGRVKTHTDLGAAKYSYVYDNAGQLVTQTNTRGQVLNFYYDTAGQQIGSVKANSFIVPSSDPNAVELNAQDNSVYAYDLAGNRVLERMTHVAGGVDLVVQDNHVSYDKQSRVTQVNDGRVSVYIEYDFLGNRRHIWTHAYNGSTPVDQHRYFLYDKMNRQVLVDAAVDPSTNPATLNELLGQTGHYITYDLNGNRISDTHYASKVVRSWDHSTTVIGTDQLGQPIYSGYVYWDYGPGLSQEIYGYDAMNQLRSVLRDGVLVDYRTYDKAGRMTSSRPTIGSFGDYETAVKKNDGVVSGLEARVNTYDNNGKLLTQTVSTPASSPLAAGTVKYEIFYNYADSYDGAGNLKRYTLRSVEGGYTNYYNYTYQNFESYQVGTIGALMNTSDGNSTGITTNIYDASGTLIKVTDSKMSENTRSYVNDVGGHVLQATQNGLIQHTLIVNGEMMGRYGWMVDAETPRNKDTGKPKMVFAADFNFGYQAITPMYPTPSPGTYAVRAGDTLSSIAQGAYGDSSLWYIIADANGLSGSEPLQVGQVLTVPNKVGTLHNSSTNYKPYDASRIIGDMTPFIPQASGGCGGWGLVLAVAIAIVVAVVVSIVTYGAAAPVMAAALGSVLGAMAAGAIAGAAGAFVSQMVLVATGVKKNLSGKDILISSAIGAVTAGIGAGFGEVAKGISTAATAANAVNSAASVAIRVVQGAMSAATANAAGQGIEMLFGARKKFSWASMLASATSGAIGAGIYPTTAGAVGASGEGFGRALAGRTATNLLLGAVATTIQDPTWSGGKLQVASVAADAFGSALGSSVDDVGRAQIEKQIQEFHEKLQLHANMGALQAGAKLELRRPSVLGYADANYADAGDDLVSTEQAVREALKEFRDSREQMRTNGALAAEDSIRVDFGDIDTYRNPVFNIASEQDAQPFDDNTLVGRARAMRQRNLGTRNDAGVFLLGFDAPSATVKASSAIKQKPNLPDDSDIVAQLAGDDGDHVLTFANIESSGVDIDLMSYAPPVPPRLMSLSPAPPIPDPTLGDAFVDYLKEERDILLEAGKRLVHPFVELNNILYDGARLAYMTVADTGNWVERDGRKYDEKGNELDFFNPLGMTSDYARNYSARLALGHDPVAAGIVEGAKPVVETATFFLPTRALVGMGGFSMFQAYRNDDPAGVVAGGLGLMGLYKAPTVNGRPLPSNKEMALQRELAAQRAAERADIESLQTTLLRERLGEKLGGGQLSDVHSISGTDKVVVKISKDLLPEDMMDGVDSYEISQGILENEHGLLTSLDDKGYPVAQSYGMTNVLHPETGKIVPGLLLERVPGVTAEMGPMNSKGIWSAVKGGGGLNGETLRPTSPAAQRPPTDFTMLNENSIAGLRATEALQIKLGEVIDDQQFLFSSEPGLNYGKAYLADPLAVVESAFINKGSQARNKQVTTRLMEWAQANGTHYGPPGYSLPTAPPPPRLSFSALAGKRFNENALPLLNDLRYRIAASGLVHNANVINEIYDRRRLAGQAVPVLGANPRGTLSGIVSLRDSMIRNAYFRTVNLQLSSAILDLNSTSDPAKQAAIARQAIFERHRLTAEAQRNVTARTWIKMFINADFNKSALKDLADIYATTEGKTTIELEKKLNGLRPTARLVTANNIGQSLGLAHVMLGTPYSLRNIYSAPEAERTRAIYGEVGAQVASYAGGQIGSGLGGYAIGMTTMKLMSVIPGLQQYSKAAVWGSMVLGGTIFGGSVGSAILAPQGRDLGTHIYDDLMRY
jgi:YD repeat-containing protein